MAKLEKPSAIDYLDEVSQSMFRNRKGGNSNVEKDADINYHLVLKTFS